MSKLIPDRTVCWKDQYQGWHVGVTFLNDGLREGDESTTLVRHKHTGELEWVPHCWLSDYPMEPIPEPGDVGSCSGGASNYSACMELKNLEDWKQSFEAAKKVMPKENWPRETDLAWEEDREKDMLGQRIHVLTMEDRLKLEEASARRAEKIARIKAMEESLAKWQPVKPKLSDLYRGNQTLCIGVMPE